MRSIIGGLLGATLYFTLAYLCITLSRFDSTLAAIWFPSAGAVAVLLKARLSNELPFYAAAFCASMLANMTGGTAFDVSAVFSIANMTNVFIVTWLTRRTCGIYPDMTDLSSLTRFVGAGGIVGPLIAASIAAIAMGLGSLPGDVGSFGTGAGIDAVDWTVVWSGAFAWFLTDSMGMILIVPTVLLASDSIARWRAPSPAQVVEGLALIVTSISCVFAVFIQSSYPLLFLIPPITMLHAFRQGSMGTALHVALVAVVATILTFQGNGPISLANVSTEGRLHILQAFIAANFLTGLPVSAVLAGRDRLTVELAVGRRELALLASNITDAVLKLDASGICTYASPSVRDVLGREPAEFIGHPITRRTHEDASDRIADVLDQLQSGASEKERLTYRRLLDDEKSNPVYIEADCAIALDPVSGEREGIIISARDVTERVELELLLTRARRHAENAANAKSVFLANMSHEIRTPMNGVLGFAELMLQGDLEPEQRRHTEMIVQSGRSMMLLLNDVLDLSKIEAGQISINKGPVDLHTTLDQCVTLHLANAQSKGLKLTLERADPVDAASTSPVIITDGLRLRQIVLNLVGNAVKFTESGGIRVDYRLDQDQLTVRIHDSGIGIGMSRLEKIFWPFTQGESNTARRFGGTGLGLSISRQLAELLGGIITVESEPGVGSTFTLELPTQVLSDEEVNAWQPAPDSVSLPTQSKPANRSPHTTASLPKQPRILLAEDHDINRMLVTEMLKRCGQSVAIAHDGNEAISMVFDRMVRGEPYDLVLMDIQMPGCDGYAATLAIREEGIGPDTLPIIALTANAYPEDVAAARKAGMQAHLAKPLVFADLAKVLQRWLPTQIVESPMDCNLQHGTERSGADTADEVQADTLAKFSDDGKGDGDAAAAAAAEADGMETDPLPAVKTPSRKAGADSSALSRNLLDRWLTRRSETVEAVRNALAKGALGDGAADQSVRGELITLVHKLAGTAATFGEPELGDQAHLLERGLRSQLDARECEALAFDLLTLADEPSGVIAQALPNLR